MKKIIFKSYKFIVGILTVLVLLFSQNAYAAPGIDNEAAMRFNEYYNNGVTLYKAGKYSSAILEFKKVLRAKPYDLTVKNALVSCYLARADFYINQSNEPRKAINDFKNALFYIKYWGDPEQSQPNTSLIASTLASLQIIETKYGTVLTPAQRLENAKTLRTQGELQAAGYDFALLFSNSTYVKVALENAGDIYKTLNNNYDAINCYRKLIKIDEKNAKAHFKYAMILDEVNNTDAATEEFNLALQYGENNMELLNTLENLWLSRTISDASDPQAYVNLAIILQKKKDFAGAQTQYFKAISLDPHDITILYNLASLYIDQNSPRDAIMVYDKILAREPNNRDVIKYRAAAQEKMKDYRGAIASYKTIMALDPLGKDGKNAKADVARVVSTYFTGQDLLNYLEVEANSNPTDFVAQYDYAFQAHKAGQLDKAIQYYKNALNINPKYIEGYINLAQIYSNKNDFQNAEGVIDWGLNINQGNQKLVEQKNNLTKEKAADMYKVATKYWDEKNYNLALENYLKIPLQTPEVLSAIAGCYSELNNNEKAIEYYKKVLEKTPNDIETLEGLAGAYLDLNKPNESRTYLEKILAINPKNTEAGNALDAIKQDEESKQLDAAIALFDKNEYTKALEAFNKIIAQTPKNAYAYYYKALIYDEQKKIPDSISHYKKAVAIDPQFSLAYYGLAIALDTSENYPEAVKNYDKYLEIRTASGEQPDDYMKYVKSRNDELKTYLKK